MKTLFLILIAALHLSSCDFDRQTQSKIDLPVYYSFDRFFVAPLTTSGDTMMLYTDTGGGANMIYERTVDELDLEVEQIVVGDDSVRVVPMPSFSPDASIPAPPLLKPFGDKLLVFEGEDHSGSGFLGRLWFATRIWEFDYPGKALSMLTQVDWSARTEDHRTPLGFQIDSTGTPTTYFPRVAIVVGGDSLDLLFDTGATARLSKMAASEFGLEENEEIGTSFITESWFSHWQKNHPDWQVIEHADKTLDMPMIRVPEISIAGHVTGPVWFTMRPDKNFTEYMSQWMDQPIEGAIGGSALKYFKITVDYTAQQAEFQLVN